MPVQLNSVEQLHSYLKGIIKRARHHAQETEDILLTLAGAVILEKDDNTPLEAGSYRGNVANVLWATIHGQRYVFTYNSDDQQVVIKRGTTRGIAVGEFDNNTSTRQIIRIFRQL
jgi:hypothetical protein